jgi:hypothetical protein
MGTEHHCIKEVKQYLDGHGREVMEYVQVFGKDTEPNFYRGKVNIKVQVMTPRGPMVEVMPFEFNFPDGVGLKKAFDTFDEVAKQAIDEHTKKMREQAAANKIVPASAVPPLKIVGPDGKPAG